VAGLDEILAGEDFLGLEESEQIARLQGENDTFRAAYAKSPEKSTEFLRGKLGRGGRETAFDDIIARASVKHRIDPRLLKAQIQAESGFDPDAVSPAGAQGLMQIMPGTQKELGITNPFDAEQSIMGGASYLRKQRDRFGRWDHALAAYNAGGRTVAEYEGIPPYEETQNYVRRIMADWESQAPAASTATAAPREAVKPPPNLPPPAGEESPAGSSAAERATRQAGYGFAESFTDTAQLIGHGANWVLGSMGLPETDIPEAIGAWEEENLPEAVTAEGRVARLTGYGAGFGLQAFGVGTLAAASKVPWLARAARFITAGPATELAAGAAGGTAQGLAAEHTDSTIAQIGAGIAGAVTAGGLVEAGVRKYGRAALIGEVAEQEAGIAAARASRAAAPNAPTPRAAEGARIPWSTREGTPVQRAEAFDALPGDAEVTLFHATSDANAANLIGGGKAVPQRQGRGIEAIDDGIYVGTDPISVEGMGPRILAVTVKKSQVSPSSEFLRTSPDGTAGRALVQGAATGGVVRGKPIRVEDVTDAGRYATAAEAPTPRAAGATRVINPLDREGQHAAFDRLTTEQAKRMDAPPEAVKRATEFHGMKIMDEMTEGVAKTIDLETTTNLMNAYKQFLKGAPASFLRVNPGKSVTLNVREAIQSGTMNLDEIKPILDANGITLEEFVMGFQSTTSNAGRILQQMSAARKAEKRMLRDIEASGGASEADFKRLRELEGVDIEPMGFWRRLENVRRGMLVTQLSTAMRNAETQVANLTVNTMGQIMEGAMHQVIRGGARAVGKEWTPARSADALGPLSRIFVSPLKTKRQVDEMMKMESFTDDMHRLFFRSASEADGIPALKQTGVLSGFENTARILNTANRFQEYTIRRAVFASELDRSLAASGKQLADLESAGKLGTIDRAHVKQAVDRALEMTWGKEFNRNAMGAEGFAGKFIDLVNHTGVGPVRLTQVIPFPRFMMNAIKWQYQHSPLGLMKMLYRKSEWEKVAQGDVSTITKASLGTGMLMTAHQIRDSEYAGERWYEIRPGAEQAEWLNENLNIDMFERDEAGNIVMDEVTGKPNIGTFDTRPFNPFASYLFAADVAKRIGDGTLNRMSTRDIAMGFLAVNMRAGAGLFILDKALDDWTQGLQVDENLPPEEKAQAQAEAFGRGVAGYAGAAWSGMLVPFQQLNDAFASFDQAMGGDPRAVKDANADPMFGQFRTKLAAFGAAEGLPDRELPTRAAPPVNLAPGARQLTGATIRGPKNAAEKELDRLQFSRGEILPGSGNDAWDRIVTKHMGPAFERYVVPRVSSGRYQRANDAAKSQLMRGYLKRARDVARRKARREDRALGREVDEMRRPRRERRAKAAREKGRAAAREAYLISQGVIDGG